MPNLISQYNSDVEREIDILERTHQIEMDEIMSVYLENTAISEICDLYTEGTKETTDETQSATAPEKKKINFSEVIGKIFTAISRFISDMITTISNAFNKKENLSTDGYLASKTGQLHLSRDIEKLNREADEEIARGHKLIHLIASKTGASDADVYAFTQKVTSIIKSVAPIAIPFAAGMVIRKKAKSDWTKKHDTVEEIHKTIDNATNLDDKKQSQVVKVARSLDDLIESLSKGYKELF